VTVKELQITLRALYEGATPRGVRFRYALLVFDVVTILFIIATSFLPSTDVTDLIDVAFGILILADFAARLFISRSRMRDLTRVSTWTDIVAIVSFLAPLAGEAGGFLRILRTLRLLRDYQMLTRLRSDFGFFRRNEEVIFAVTNLAVFIFIMTAVVYETQKFRHPQIGNYADALYFTVTALTTTGFGDITLQGHGGRLLAILIMAVGVGLFLRLLQAIFRPDKVQYECQDCGLLLHDPDAVHCKHCGHLLHIRTEGQI
jgi:voltage-gated potassium channel